MFEEFDFGVLDDPTFKEDAVREEIIAPMLRRLGFAPSGEKRVQRSQNLVHPYVMIGTRKHKVNIVPDYTFWLGARPLLILDAKAPSEEILQSQHAEQAYSYAIHPEVRAAHFALCNGRRLVVWDVARFEPVLDVVAADYDRRWDDIERIMRPESLANPAYRDFDPDFGLALQRMGTASGAFVEMREFQLQGVARIEDGKYCAHASAMIGDQVYLASLDFPEDALAPMLSCLAKPLLDGVLLAMKRAPFFVSLDLMVEVDLVGILGPLTNGQHDAFHPIDVVGIRGTRFDRSEKVQREPVPNHVHSLRRAYGILQDELASR